MAAIITEQFRKNASSLFKNDIDTNTYYIAIGQQDEWDDIISDNDAAPFPLGTYSDEKRVLDHLTALFRVTGSNVSSVIPKNDFDSLSSYKKFDPFDPSCFYGCSDTGLKPCYITVSDNKILLCISKDFDAETAGEFDLITDFSEITDYGFYTSSEGAYTWVYIGNYNQFDSINTNSFISVNNDVLSESSTTADITAGAVYGFRVINGGNIYRHPTITGEYTFNVDGKLIGLDVNGAEKELTVKLKVTVDSGNLGADPADDTATITRVEFDKGEGNFPYDINFETNLPVDGNLAAYYFKNCRLEFDSLLLEESAPAAGDNILQTVDVTRPAESERKEAVIFPFVAPKEGFGGIKLDTLPSWYVGIYADTAIAPYIPNNVKYRQISLLKNPLDGITVGTPPLTGSYINALRSFELDGEGTNPKVQTIPIIEGVEIGPGWEIWQSGKKHGVISFIQTIDTNANQTPLASFQYYYYSDHKYGYLEIDDQSLLTFKSPDGQYEGEYTQTITSVNNSNYLQGSGNILFIDNRAGIQREEGQNEELKLIIQL